MEQGTKEWLDMRKNFIMASDAPVVMGVSPWRTPHQLWKEKLGIGPAQKQNAAMRYGKENEHKARLAYQVYSGHSVKPQVIFHPTIGFMGASLDGLTDNGDMAVEIKCAGLNDHITAREGKIPDKYKPQIQHQIACLGINLLHYFSFRQDEGIIVEVERDEKYIDNLYGKEEKFWNKVLNLDAPNLVARDYVDKGGDKEYQTVLDRVIERRPFLDSMKEEDKADKELLIIMSGDCSSIGRGGRLARIIRKGTIDYQAIPELVGVDLEKYRKPPIETWRLDLK